MAHANSVAIHATGERAIASAAVATSNPRAVARLLPWLLGTALLLVTSAAFAQRVEGDRAAAQGVYSAEVEVNGQGGGERDAAFARALAQVLGKLSGDRGAASKPGIGRELRRAGQYVDSYDYRQDEGVSASGAPSFKTMLVVRFDRGQVDSLVTALGLPIWPQPRPKPVLWLAIDDGSGPRLVGLPKAAAARSTLDRAEQRGFRLGLPNGSAAEQAVVGAIWRGDAAAVARASRRYSPPMQLIGKLYRHDGGWKADWTFVDDGEVLSRWSETGGNALRVMATGADGAADALMERYAKVPETGPDGAPGIYRVAFSGMASADDYVRLSGYLQQLAVVRGLTPLRATPQTVEFDLDLISGLSGLRRMVDGGDVLVEGTIEGGEPVFRLR